MGRSWPIFLTTATWRSEVRGALSAALLFLLLVSRCSKKAEIVPEGASHITRSDTVVENGGNAYQMRSYTFQMNLPGGVVSFFCEAKKFTTSTQALLAAEKSIPQRPDEQQKNNAAWYARAGLSQWLLVDRTLTWCMNSSPHHAVHGAAQEKLREAFLQKFSEASS